MRAASRSPLSFSKHLKFFNSFLSVENEQIILDSCQLWVAICQFSALSSRFPVASWRRARTHNWSICRIVNYLANESRSDSRQSRTRIEAMHSGAKCNGFGDNTSPDPLSCHLRKWGLIYQQLQAHKYLADTFVATTLAAVDTLLTLKRQVERVLSGNWY